jgi:hypothetical protein
MMTGDMSANSIKSEWDEAPVDPDPRQNLDYDLQDWEVIAPENGRDHFVMLPSDEAQLREEAFIIVAESNVKDVLEYL